MSKKKISIICAVVLFVCAVAGGFAWSGMKATAMETQMTMDLSASTVDRDEEIQVTVTAASGMSMSYVDAFLSYDPTLLEFVDTSDDMATGGEGTIHIMENLDYGISEKSYVLTFKALELGTCEFSLYDVYIEEFDTLDMLNLPGQSAAVEIVMNEQVSDDARLKELMVADTDVDKIFDPDTFTYDLEVSQSMGILIFSTVPMAEDSTILAPEDLTLAPGLNVFEIQVTAPAGNTQTYTLNVTRLDYEKETEAETETETETESETETETLLESETVTETESEVLTESEPEETIPEESETVSESVSEETAAEETGGDQVVTEELQEVVPEAAVEE